MSSERRELPSGTLTFLFSDIEGSTALWERAPEAMSSALASHDRLLRETFESGGGKVFAHRGDGLSVVFITASDAVRAALAALRANVAQDWSDLGLVRIRIGIHTGEAVQRDDNYFGSTLNLTSRLTAAAHGNQILVSDTVRALVGERVDDHAWLEDLGSWFFDGLTHAERVHQVRDPGLGEAPTTLRAGRPAGATLPTALGRFVGRDAECRTIVEAFDTARLVTLCGVAGAGKTRLAIETAVALTERFTAGPRFVDLTRVREASAVLPQIADALAVKLLPGADTIDGVARNLAGSPVLVVLDNCEHLTDIVAEHVSGLLQRCPNAGVLATSRETLRVPGERVIEIRPLAIGSVASPGAAVELLLDRARSADAVVDDDDPALHDLAQAVDGLPLALELLAPRLTHMKPDELAVQLSEIGLLASLEDRPERARDARLRTAFASSYGMLAEAAQRLFAALSVCVSGTTIEGAQHLATGVGIPVTGVRGVLSGLVDESLVVVDTSGSQSRYRMLQPVREFATEHLTDLGCVNEVELAHVSYLAKFVEREGAALRGPREAQAVERIDADFDNLRAAARWCVDTNRPDLGFRIVAPLVDHLLSRGRFEVGTWALAMTEVPGADLDALFPVGLGLAALTAMEGGRLDDASALSARALDAEAVAGKARSWIPYSVRALMTAAGVVPGDLRLALAALWEVADAADDELGRAVYHFDRATIDMFRGKPAKVLDSALELETLGMTTGSPSISAMGSMFKGWSRAADNRPTDAAEALRRSITLATSVRNTAIAEMANRDLMNLERASLQSYVETLGQFLAQDDVAQAMVTVLGMLPSLMDLGAFEAAARICGWILSTPWARSAQLSEAMRRLGEHLDEATAQAARAAGERMDLDQLVRFLRATIGEIHDSS